MTYDAQPFVCRGCKRKFDPAVLRTMLEATIPFLPDELRAKVDDLLALV